MTASGPAAACRAGLGFLTSAMSKPAALITFAGDADHLRGFCMMPCGSTKTAVCWLPLVSQRMKSVWRLPASTRPMSFLPRRRSENLDGTWPREVTCHARYTRLCPATGRPAGGQTQRFAGRTFSRFPTPRLFCAQAVTARTRDSTVAVMAGRSPAAVRQRAKQRRVMLGFNRLMTTPFGTGPRPRRGISAMPSPAATRARSV